MELDTIAEWNYSQEEWNAFVRIERSNKKEDSIYFGIGIVIIGTLGVMFLRDTSFWTALAFSVPLAILIPFLRMTFSYKHLKKGISNAKVQFFSDFIRVNDHKIELLSSQKRIKSIKIIDTKDPTKHLLEFDVEWITRKGPTNDEFRFLIPNGKMGEAERILNAYSNH